MDLDGGCLLRLGLAALRARRMVVLAVVLEGDAAERVKGRDRVSVCVSVREREREPPWRQPRGQYMVS